MLGVCPAVMQDKPLVCECGKPFSPGQAMRCKCYQGARTVCHDISVGSGWRACVQKSGQASTRDPADRDLQGASLAQLWSMVSVSTFIWFTVLAVLVQIL